MNVEASQNYRDRAEPDQRKDECWLTAPIRSTGCRSVNDRNESAGIASRPPPSFQFRENIVLIASVCMTFCIILFDIQRVVLISIAVIESGKDKRFEVETLQFRSS